jgi:hypothetical protein
MQAREEQQPNAYSPRKRIEGVKQSDLSREEENMARGIHIRKPDTPSL